MEKNIVTGYLKNAIRNILSFFYLSIKLVNFTPTPKHLQNDNLVLSKIREM